MKYLITGGAGFIGSHLAEIILQNDDEVYIIDNLSTGSIDNIRHILENKKYKNKLFFYEDTILNHEKMLELVGICDAVFHLAAAVGVRYILDNPLTSIQININGTEKVLALCAKFKKKVLIASSSEVYGKHLHAPLIETDNVIYGPSSKIRWCYAASKLIDEFLSISYNRIKDLHVVIVRLFNTVGPRQTAAYGMVIPRLMEQALNNKPLSVYADGSQSRTFTHVKDVVRALFSIINNKEACGEVYNVGGIEEITIKELAEKIIKQTNSKSEIQYIPYEQAFEKDFEDMHRRVPSIEKINKLTGFKPELTLDTILQEVETFIKNSS